MNELLLNNSHTLTALLPLNQNTARAGVGPCKEQLLSMDDGKLNAVYNATSAFGNPVKARDKDKKERQDLKSMCSLSF